MQERSALTSIPNLDVLCLAKVDDAVLAEMLESDAYIRSLTLRTELWYAKVELSFGDVLKLKPLTTHIENFYMEARRVHTRITRKGTCGALLQAAKNNNLMDMRIVLHVGADVNAADKSGNTPLIWAFRLGRLEAVKELIRAGANVNASNNSGWTALLYASDRGHLEVVKELVEHGANVNAAANNARTALSYAAENGHLEVVKELIQHGVNVHAAANNARTALSYASEKNHTAIADALRAHGAH